MGTLLTEVGRLSYVVKFLLAECILEKRHLVILLVIAVISSVIGVGLWIASAVLVYSKSVDTSYV